MNDQLICADRVESASRITIARERVILHVIEVRYTQIIGSARNKRIAQVGIVPNSVFTWCCCIVIKCKLLSSGIEQSNVRTQSARTIEQCVNVEVYDLSRADQERDHIDIDIRHDPRTYCYRGRRNCSERLCLGNRVVRIDWNCLYDELVASNGIEPACRIAIAGHCVVLNIIVIGNAKIVGPGGSKRIP